MAHRTTWRLWSLPIALAIAACQAAPTTSIDPVPAPDLTATIGPTGGQAYQLFAAPGLAIAQISVDSALQPKERLTDGNAATAWTNGGYRNATSWVTLQLAENTPLGELRLKTGPLAPGTRYDVQVSSDGTRWKTVLADQTNTTWNMETKRLPAGTRGQFMRLFFRNSAMAHVSVYECALVAAGAVPDRGEWPDDPRPTPRPTPTGATGGSFAQHYPDLLGIAPTGFYLDTRTRGRRLLRFPTAIGNPGPGHLQIRGRIEGMVTRGTQEILDHAGRVVMTRDVGTFELHPDHGHFHVGNVARYELRRGDVNGTFVQPGKKISFCLVDSLRIGPSREASRTPDCTQTIQGITRGFADLYTANLPDQSFDFTHLGSGEYTIVIQLDPNRKFLEASRHNNTAWVRLRYDAASARVTRLASYP